MRGTQPAVKAPRPTYGDMAPMGLTDQCRPMTTGMVLHMLEGPTDHDETVRWPFQGDFSKVVLADHLQPQKDRQQHEMCETDACKGDL